MTQKITYQLFRGFLDALPRSEKITKMVSNGFQNGFQWGFLFRTEEMDQGILETAVCYLCVMFVCIRGLKVSAYVLEFALSVLFMITINIFLKSKRYL